MPSPIFVTQSYQKSITAMLSARFVGFCIGLFVCSALVSISLRSTSFSPTWPILSGRLKDSKGTSSNYDHVAFATFLADTNNNQDTDRDNVTKDKAINRTRETDEDDARDGYFLGTRVLTYNLLHNPITRSKLPIPFIVMVTEDVTARKRAILVAEGADVVPVAKLDVPWVHPGSDRWRDVFAKLRLFQMTKYKKICFIDADMLVTAPLDGVFDDPATDLVRTRKDESAIKDDEAELPPAYMFAGKPDAWGYEHAIPPEVGTGKDGYLNSGFFVIHPSIALFDYYTSLLKHEGRFDGRFPEQNLFNYAHRKDGNMPWTMLNWRWNMNWPTAKDWEAGARSFHAKYWDGDPTHDEKLKTIWERQRIEMDGYYQGIAEIKGQ